MSCSSEHETDLSKPQLSIYLLGSRDLGQSIFINLWSGSAPAVALNSLATVQVTNETDLNSVLLPSPTEHSSKLSVYLVFFNSQDQETTDYVHTCIENLQTSSPTQIIPEIHLIETSDHQPKSLPSVLDQYSSVLTLHQLIINNASTSDLIPLYKDTIYRSFLKLINKEEVFEQAVANACAKGYFDVLKGFIDLGLSCDSTRLLTVLLECLQPLSCTDKIVPNLLTTAEYIYKIEPQKAKDFILSSIEQFPRSSLMLLTRFTNPFSDNPQVLFLSSLGLPSLSSKSVAESRYTHIVLTSNRITTIPEELFQLPAVITLDLANNELKRIPPITRWNCPKLRELSLSNNRLVDVQSNLFKSAGQAGRRISMHVGLTNDSHAAPQRMVLRLTGQNLYSCIHSLTTVDISHNPSLTRVPEWVCVLPHVACITLRGLPKLTALPSELGYWDGLSIIQLEPEKMTSPPASVCAQGSKAIIAYLRSQLKGSTHYRRMGIMMLGGDKSGKTTLLKALVNSKQSSSSSTSSSLSSNSNSYDYRGKVSGESYLKITYHFLDVSASAMMYHVHQSFLVKRCVYLILANAQEGKNGLHSLLPQLRHLASCVSEARVILLVTHVDKIPNVALSDVLSWMKEAFLVEHPSSLNNPLYASSCGLPTIARLFMLNASDPSNIEEVKEAIHWLVGDMLGYSPDPKTEEAIPRMYITVQGMIDTRLKHYQNQPNILKYEEFYDNFKTLSGDINEEEFNLACSFLQESGAIQVQHMMDSSGLYFLNCQWLLDAIAKTLDTLTPTAYGVVGIHEVKSAVGTAAIPSYCQDGFIKLLEDKRLIVPIDIEKTKYLVFHHLPSVPSHGYKPCSPALPDVLVRLISCSPSSLEPSSSSSDPLPSGLLPSLQYQIITTLYRLGAHLMVIDNAKKAPKDLLPNSYSGIDSIKKTKAFTLSSRGYVENKSRKDMESTDGTAEGQSEGMDRIRAMSFSSRIDTIQQNLTHVKVRSVSKASSFHFASGSDSSWISDGTFWQGIFWKEGVYMEYGDGTIAWIESNRSTITIATQGCELACIKALMFLTSCFDSVVEDRFPYLKTETLVPCSACISSKGAIATASSMDKSSFFSLNEIVSKAVDPNVKHVTCTKCQANVGLDKLAPELFLKDFDPQYILEDTAVQQQIEEDDSTLACEQQYGPRNKIHLGTYNDNNVTIKSFQETDVLKTFSNLRLELNILSSLSHRNLLAPLGAVLRPSRALIFPRAPLGSLHDHIQLCPSGFNDHISHQLLYQIANGLHYLHSFFIIHRNIKPRNILVWSLDPVTGVHVKISDCGRSQYNSSVMQLGETEDHMAPELSSPAKRLFYNEKVDIFSFGIMLYSIVSGKSLVPGLLFKPDSQITNLSLSLGQAITSSMEEQRPRDQPSPQAASILRNGVHPASRQGLVSMCVAKCLQSLLRDCLWKDPSRRPSAEGICSHLLLCTAPSTQERIIIQQNFPIVGSVKVPGDGSIIAWGNHGDQVMTVSKDVWNVSKVCLQLPEGFVRSRNVMCVTSTSLFIVSCKSRQLFSFSVTDLMNKTASAPKNVLPSNPCCLFSSPDEDRLYVGMEGGRVAVFTSIDGKSPLETPPIIGRTLEHPDRKKTPIRCGVVVNDSVLCGCGRYLIGLDHKNLQQRFFKPLTDQGTMIDGIVSSETSLWVWFTDCGEVIVCDARTGNRTDSINIRKCLEENVPNSSQVLVTTVSMATVTVWVGTNTGHVMGFNSTTLELLVAVQHHSIVESIVSLNDEANMMLVFGKWTMEDTAGAVLEGFSAWQLHLRAMFKDS